MGERQPRDNRRLPDARARNGDYALERERVEYGRAGIRANQTDGLVKRKTLVVSARHDADAVAWAGAIDARLESRAAAGVRVRCRQWSRSRETVQTQREQQHTGERHHTAETDAKL